MNKKQLIGLAPVVTAAVFAMAAPVALSQNQGNSGYQISAGSQHVSKNAAAPCWRAGYWTPAHAIMECDPDLLPKGQTRPVSDNKTKEGRAQKRRVEITGTQQSRQGNPG